LPQLKAWLSRHPVAGFVALAFGISYLLGIPFLVFASGAIPPHLHLARLYGPRLLIVYGPATAGLIMSAAGGTGIRALLSKLNPTRSDAVVGTLIVAAGVAASAAGLLSSGVTMESLRTTVRANAGLLAANFILQLVCIGIGEELGWRGWLLPVLASRMSRLRATLVAAAIWTLWHGPRLFDRPAAVVLFAISVFGLSFVFTWLWSQTGHRLLPVVVAHAIVNTPMFFLEQTGSVAPDRLQSAWMMIHVIYTILGVTLVMWRWNWWVAPPHSPRGEWPIELDSATHSRREVP